MPDILHLWLEDRKGKNNLIAFRARIYIISTNLVKRTHTLKCSRRAGRQRVCGLHSQLLCLLPSPKAREQTNARDASSPWGLAGMCERRGSGRAVPRGSPGSAPGAAATAATQSRSRAPTRTSSQRFSCSVLIPHWETRRVLGTLLRRKLVNLTKSCDKTSFRDVLAWQPNSEPRFSSAPPPTCGPATNVVSWMLGFLFFASGNAPPNRLCSGCSSRSPHTKLLCSERSVRIVLPPEVHPSTVLSPQRRQPAGAAPRAALRPPQQRARFCVWSRSRKSAKKRLSKNPDHTTPFKLSFPIKQSQALRCCNGGEKAPQSLKTSLSCALSERNCYETAVN